MSVDKMGMSGELAQNESGQQVRSLVRIAFAGNFFETSRD
jgi:hypothetical protein